MSDVRRVDLSEVVKHFESLDDPRCSINLRHPLISVVVIAVMAILAGCNGPTSIARWARLKQDFLLQALDLPRGIPAKDVFRRVLMHLSPAAFQACFANWIASLRLAAEQKTDVDQPVLAVDGKTARRSHDHSKGLGALHAVTVWASELGLALGQVACEQKSNEITAIPELLRLVDIAGTIITIDALGTQKAIAKQIVDAEADYVLALKGNHETLHQGVIDHLTEQLEKDFAGGEVQRYETQETGHGRQETRSYYQLAVPKDFPQVELWEGLRSIGMVVSQCVREGKETIEIRYFISSLAVNVEQFARAVRSHWGVENGCHWSLDIIYREDESRIRDKNLRENLAWLNRWTLSLLKQHPSKLSTVMKRRSCGWSEEFLMEVLTGSTP